MKDCCSQGVPCGLGQGDCDQDTECKDDLICGGIGGGDGNNCGHDFLYATAECCRKPGKSHIISQVFIL